MKLQLLTLSLLAGASDAFAPIGTPATASTTTTTSLEASRRDMMEQTAALLTGAAILTVATPSFAEGLPMYLSEPTADFKASEEKAMAFKRKELAQKKKFAEAIEKLQNEKDDEAALEEDIVALRRLVIECEGLPTGIKKDDFYKQIRSKKAKGFWPTKVEIAYVFRVVVVFFCFVSSWCWCQLCGYSLYTGMKQSDKE